jgi:hypothetical protein
MNRYVCTEPAETNDRFDYSSQIELSSRSDQMRPYGTLLYNGAGLANRHDILPTPSYLGQFYRDRSIELAAVIPFSHVALLSIRSLPAESGGTVRSGTHRSRVEGCDFGMSVLMQNHNPLGYAPAVA